MTPKFTAEEFIDAIYDDYDKRGERLNHNTIIELKYVQELMGASDDEMYLLLNCIDDRIRLRANLEEQASQKRFHMMHHPLLPHYLDFYLEFYREPIEGQDYDDKDHFKGGNELDYENYKQEIIATFPQAIRNLTVRFAELERFANHNRNVFNPLGAHFDFSKISFEYMMREILNKEQCTSPKQTRKRGRPFENEKRDKSLKAASLAYHEVASSNHKTNYKQFKNLCNQKMKEIMIQSGEKSDDEIQARIEAVKLAWEKIPDELKGRRKKRDKSN